MKKLVAGVVTLLVLAYPASTWWAGKKIEATLDEQYKTLEQVPFIKVTKRDFQRGFASSTEVVTYEVLGDFIRGLGDLEGQGGDKPAADAKKPEPLSFTVRNLIKHGPFAGGQLASAVIDSELVFDDKTKQELAKVFGDKQPLTAHTVFGFDGGGRTAMQSPAFTHTIEGDNAGTVSWGGVKADMSFTRDIASFTLQGLMPKLEIKDRKGTHMLLSEIKMSGDQKRMFADEPLLYGGTQRFEVAQIQFSAPPTEGSPMAAEGLGLKAPQTPVLLKNVSYTVDAPFNGGEFMDIAARMSSASLLIDQKEYGPAHYDVSMKHLHARTVAKIYRSVMQIYADPAALKSDPSAALAAIAEPAKALLGHNPEFSIDRISFNSPQGEAQISARIKLNGAKPEELAQPMALIGKIDAAAELKLPAALLADIGSAKAESPEEKQMQQQMFAAQLDAMSEQGYVTQSKGMLESKIVFQNGQLTINGKPFDPRNMRAQEK